MAEYKIPEERMDDVMSVYWQMMRHMEQTAYESKNSVDKLIVQGAFQLWNDITGSNHKPLWKKQNENA